MFDFANVLIAVLCACGLVLAVNPFVLIAFVPLTAAFLALRSYYMLTSRQVKHLEAQSRSPMFTLLAEYLAGLPVLRAFRMQRAAVLAFNDACDANLRAYFAFLATSRWFGIRIDALCLLLLTSTAFACVGVDAAAKTADGGPPRASPALVGLALVSVMTITNTLQWAVRQSSEVENNLVAVARILEYASLSTEDVDLRGTTKPEALLAPGTLDGGASSLLLVPSTTAEGPTIPPSASVSAVAAMTMGSAAMATAGDVAAAGDVAVTVSLGGAVFIPATWPTAGRLTLRNVHLRYRADLPWVLRGLDLDVPAGARVGVVGRTGAGKSSFVSAILRLTPSQQGAKSGASAEGAAHGGAKGGAPAESTAPSPPTGIAIDGIDTSHIHLTRLRRSVAYIPQDPVLFAGTVRSNLDPFAEHSDDECWAALDAVQLGRVFRWARAGGLQCAIEDSGANLSAGQRQLLCLARAALRGARLVLCDEATASVDRDTDDEVQRVLASAFPNSTLVSVAHRLETVVDYDLVVVLHSGAVAEVGEPAELLARGAALGDAAAQDGPGAFALLVRESGAAAALALTERAQGAASLRRRVEGGGGGA